MIDLIRKSRYSDQVNNDIKLALLDALTENVESSITIAQIKSSSIFLSNITMQKIARMLGSMCEIGLVRKEKGRDGLMHYSLLNVEVA